MKKELVDYALYMMEEYFDETCNAEADKQTLNAISLCVKLLLEKQKTL